MVSEKITNFVKSGAILFTDEFSIYSNIIEHPKIIEHHTVNHSQKEYARGKIHVNNCENRHSLLRPFLRMYRGISKHNLGGYLTLFQYLFNYKEDAYDKILQTILKYETY